MWKVASAALVLGLAGMGCGKTVNTVEPRYSLAEPHVIPDRRVVVDPILKSRLRVGELTTGVTTAGLLTVQVSLHSSSSQEHTYEYCFEWMNDHGVRVDTPVSHWALTIVPAGDVKSLTGVAPAPEVKDFVFKVKRH